MSFKKLISESLDRTKVTELAIFDFDGTTMDTLYPEIGRPIYKEKTGEDWPFKGWWVDQNHLTWMYLTSSQFQKLRLTMIR